MTINNATSKVTFHGNGATTVWPVGMYVADLSTLKLTVTRANGSHEAVSPADFSATGIGLTVVVTYPLTGSPLTAQEELEIRRELQYVQPLDFTNQTALYADQIEAGFDNVVMLTQQLNTALQNALIEEPGGYYEVHAKRIVNVGTPVDGLDAVRLIDLQAWQIAAGNVPSPLAPQVGWVLKATGVGTFGWGQIDSTLISDSTSIGRSLLTAASQAAARTAIGAAASSSTTLAFILGYRISPPAGPSTNDAYAVANDTPTGAWAGQGNKIATWNGSAWAFTTPDAGTHYVDVVTGRKFYFYNSAWLPDPSDLPGRIMQHGSNVVPAGALECDGSAVSRATYYLLFKALVKTATATMTIASPAVVTWTGHGLRVDDPVKFTTTGALPTGVTAGTTYYVSAVVDANTFRIKNSTGTVINTSGSQSGTHTAINAPWGDGDGSTTFNLPLLRGEFLRALDNGRGVDANRSIGSAQSELIGNHVHPQTGASGLAPAAGAYQMAGSMGSASINSTKNNTGGGSETRPRNVAVPMLVRI